MKAVIITGVLTGQRMLKEPHCRSLTIHTNELMTEQKEGLEILHNQFIKVLISPDEISNEMKKAVEEVKLNEEGKTQSQRIRAVLFRNWEADNEGKDFDTYYREKTEKIINHFKSKLD